MPNDMNDLPEGKLVTLEADASTVALLNKSEIDQQIATAHKYPRSVKGFRDEVLTLATLNEDVAEECSYALPRADKTIIGPSARFAEIIASSWGNCRAGARVVEDRGDTIVAQGAFMDLQKNVAITYEVQRRIVDSRGRRYSPDMISVTANAACSIALRNAVLKGVPKAYWNDLWEKARSVAVGDATTLANRRGAAVSKLSHFGVTPEMIVAKLGRASMDDVTVDDLGVLLGIFNALKEGEITPEEAFKVADDPKDTPPAPQAGTAGVKDKLAKKAAAKPAAKPAAPDWAAAQGAVGTVSVGGNVPTFAEVASQIEAAKDGDSYNLAVDAIRGVADEGQRAELTAIAVKKRESLEAGLRG